MSLVLENPPSLDKNTFMRTTLDLPDPIFRQLKAESALRGLKMKELVAELLKEGLRKPSFPAGKTVRSPLPLIRKPSGNIHPARSNAEIESILAQEEDHGPA